MKLLRRLLVAAIPPFMFVLFAAYIDGNLAAAFDSGVLRFFTILFFLCGLIFAFYDKINAFTFED